MDKPGNFSGKEKRQLMRAFGLMSQMAVTSVGCIAISIWFGLWLDGRLGTSPIFLLVMAILGGISAIKALVDIAKKF
jgi:F0F1-type ATP synthase assembly protein I